MLEVMFWIAVGLFVGWNLPQPEWAKNFQLKVTKLFNDKE